MFKSRSIAWVVWIVGSIFYAYQYILRVMPNILMDQIMAQFQMNAALFGQFAGFYYIGYALFHMPIGILLDRYGPKKILPLCMMLTVIGLLPMLFSTHWSFGILGRLVMGIGSSAAILGIFKIIRLAFREEKFTMMLTFSVSIGLVGAIYGGAPLNYFCQKFGYRSGVSLLIGIGIFLSLLTYLIVPVAPKTKQYTALRGIKEVFTNPQVMVLCCCAGLMVGPLEGFADVWGTTFLKKTYRFDEMSAALLPSFMYIGMCFGGPFLSMIAQRTNYLGTISGAGFFMFGVFALMLVSCFSFDVLRVLFVIVGLCCAYQIIAIYKISTYVPEHIVGLTTAITNMIIMSFGYIFHGVIGYVVEKTNISYGITVIPVAMMIGSLGVLLCACTSFGQLKKQTQFKTEI